MSQALNRCVNCLPGQRDVDNAIRTVGEASKTLLSDSVSSTDCITTDVSYLGRCSQKINKGHFRECLLDIHCCEKVPDIEIYLDICQT